MKLFTKNPDKKERKTYQNLANKIDKQIQKDLLDETNLSLSTLQALSDVTKVSITLDVDNDIDNLDTVNVLNPVIGDHALILDEVIEYQNLVQLYTTWYLNSHYHVNDEARHLAGQRLAELVQLYVDKKVEFDTLFDYNDCVTLQPDGLLPDYDQSAKPIQFIWLREQVFDSIHMLTNRGVK